MSRYQAAATSSSGDGLKSTRRDVALTSEEVEREGTAATSDVVLELADELIARRRDDHPHRLAAGRFVAWSRSDMPNAVEASDCPSGTELIPGPDDLGQVGGLVETWSLMTASRK